MSKYETWGMNLFVLDKLTCQRPLTVVTYAIFKVIKETSPCVNYP